MRRLRMIRRNGHYQRIIVVSCAAFVAGTNASEALVIARDAIEARVSWLVEVLADKMTTRSEEEMTTDLSNSDKRRADQAAEKRRKRTMMQVEKTLKQDQQKDGIQLHSAVRI